MSSHKKSIKDPLFEKQLNNYIHQQQPNAGSQSEPWYFEDPWKQGLCALASDCNETCYGLWCFPCFTCQLAWRMNESCWITCCVPGYLSVLRTKLRTAFHIEGSYFEDWCISECCPFCSAIQMAAELRNRKVMR